MAFNRNRRRQHFSRSRRRHNWWPLIMVSSAFVLVLWLIIHLFLVLFSQASSQSGSAQLQVLNGQVSFQLPAKSNWTNTTSATFLTGDSVRTGKTGKAALKIFSGNMVFLNKDTEIKFLELEEWKSGKRVVRIELIRGELWTKVSADEFSHKNALFTVSTPRLTTYLGGTISDITHREDQDVVRIINGKAALEIYEMLGEQTSTLDTVEVGVGQKLIVSDLSIASLKEGKDILMENDNDFEESEWHLNNYEKFDPQEAARIQSQIEQKIIEQKPVEEKDIIPALPGDIESPKVISPANGARISAAESQVKIEGSAPVETFQIEVNGFALTRFQPGDKKWVYFAATKHGTLLPGENKFSIVAISRDGKRSPMTDFTIFYEAPEKVEAPPPVLSEPVSTIDLSSSEVLPVKAVHSEYPKPLMLSPQVFATGQTSYQTSAQVVTFSGTVDGRTNKVEVNGYKLRKFQPGDTKFVYTANANGGNLSVGKNKFVITAFGPDQKQASTTIYIIYSPVLIK